MIFGQQLQEKKCSKLELSERKYPKVLIQQFPVPSFRYTDVCYQYEFINFISKPYPVGFQGILAKQSWVYMYREKYAWYLLS